MSFSKSSILEQSMNKTHRIQIPKNSGGFNIFKNNIFRSILTFFFRLFLPSLTYNYFSFSAFLFNYFVMYSLTFPFFNLYFKHFSWLQKNTYRQWATLLLFIFFLLLLLLFWLLIYLFIYSTVDSFSSTFLCDHSSGWP